MTVGMKITGKVVSTRFSLNKRVATKLVGSDYVGQVRAEAIDYVVEEEDGRMWLISEDGPLATQVNFNPFTGKPAKVKLDGSKNIDTEDTFPFGDTFSDTQVQAIAEYLAIPDAAEPRILSEREKAVEVLSLLAVTTTHSLRFDLCHRIAFATNEKLIEAITKEDVSKIVTAILSVEVLGTSVNDDYLPPFKAPWNIVDTSSADESVNWPGEFITSVDDSSLVHETLKEMRGIVCRKVIKEVLTGVPS